jgi:LacI family transcriptional regulator
MGETAARMLLTRLAGGEISTAPVVLPTEMITRRSAPAA